jgi:hypothetical protein
VEQEETMLRALIIEDTPDNMKLITSIKTILNCGSSNRKKGVSGP